MSDPALPTRRPPWWIRLVGPAAAAVVLSFVDLHEITGALARVRWLPVIVAFALVVPLFVVKGWRWRLLLRREGIEIALPAAIELYFLGAGIGAVTPGAIGDLSKGLLPEVGRRSVGVWTATVDRAYDVALLVLIGLLAAVAFAEDVSLWLLGLALLFAVALAAWRFQGVLLEPLRRRIPGLEPVLGPHAPTAVAALGATVLGASIAVVRFALLVQALSLPLAGRDVLVAFVLGSGVGALPLSVAGIGTRDLALVAWLGTVGVEPAEAVALSALCLALQLWNAVVAALLWVVRPRSDVGATWPSPERGPGASEGRGGAAPR